MERRKLGSHDVSVAGLGCNNFGWRIDGSTAREVVHAALDAGVTFFDTAEMYGSGRSEEYLGKALAGRRNEVVLATKFAWDPPATTVDPVDWVVQCCEDSLRRLGTDHIDLYYYHRPHPELKVADMLEGMNRLTAEGKVLEIGCSRSSEEQLQEAAADSA